MLKEFPFIDKLGREFAMRSPLEILMAQRMDRRNKLRWDYEALRIEVPPDQQEAVGATYLIPDFQLYFPCGEQWIVEGKGVTMLGDYLRRKDPLVTQYCKENGFNYEIVLPVASEGTFDEWDHLVNVNGYSSIRDWFPKTKQELHDLWEEEDARQLGDEIGRAVHGYDW